MKEAKGAGKDIYKEFNAYVNGGTLEIHLYWSGKGTKAIPVRVVYGPLISAIAVTPSEIIPYSGFSTFPATYYLVMTVSHSPCRL